MAAFFHDQQSEVADTLLSFCDPFDPSHLFIDSLFNTPENQFYLDPDQAPFSSLPPNQFEIFEGCPKRPRTSTDLYHPSDIVFEQNSYNDRPAMGAFRAPEFMLQPLPTVLSARRLEGRGCLSVQSAAARERRKRISEKMRELGRLIPGRHKMNTAEMFQAAFKYVKLLQAQVGILQMLGTLQGCSKCSPQVEAQMQMLLATPTVQEILYGEGRCMVPKKMVEALTEEEGVKSNPLISRDLHRFISSMR